jgi:hypothetical protein
MIATTDLFVRGAARRQAYSRLLRLPRAVGPAIWPWPYAKYHGFCTHDAPVPGPAVIMHCWNEVKPQLVALRPEP